MNLLNFNSISNFFSILIKQLLPILYFILWFSYSSFSQIPDWNWAKSIIADSGIAGRKMVVDLSANIYTIGVFKDSCDFDPNSSSYNLSTTGSENIFISKLNNAGNFIWARSFQGMNNCAGYNIAVDRNSDVYSTGYYQGTVDFDPGINTFNLTASNIDLFICKLDSSGNFIWAKSISHVISTCVATDSSGNVYLSGNFSGIIDADPGPGVFNLSSSGGNAIFIIKLNNSGIFKWAKSFNEIANGIGVITSKEIVTDNSKNVYTTGQFSGTMDFDPDSGLLSITSNGFDDIYVSKLDSAGNFEWAKSFGSTGYDFANSIAADDSGNVYTTGAFQDTADFDPGPGNYNLFSKGGSDVFISKLDSLGNFVWTKVFGDGNDDIGESISIDHTGNLLTCGEFHTTVDFDPGTGIFNMNSFGNWDAYVSKFDAMGNFIWSKTAGGVSIDFGLSIGSDTSDNIYLMGDFVSSSLFFNSSILLHGNASQTVQNVFISKIGAGSTTAVEDAETDNNKVNIYPNPATNQIMVNLTVISSPATLTIFNITGEIIYSVLLNEFQKIQINTSNFTNGIYLFRIKSNDFIETKKVIVSSEAK